jgi:Uma2 family endonuclease
MSAHAQPRLTPEQYLEIERAAEFRSDYYDGRMYAMSGGCPRHAFINGNLVRELGNAIKQRPCSVAASDLRLRVGSGVLYTYPDVIVVCGEIKVAHGHSDTLTNPTVVAEVLSPSTERYDRGVKSVQYRTIDSLQEYALISQSEARMELFSRQSSGRWLLSEFVGLNAICKFESLDCSVALADIYHNITFDEINEAGSTLAE